MKTPSVNAIGLVEYPAEFTASPRAVPLKWRVLAGVLLVFFSVAVISTTVISVGRYCLTSDGGDTRELPRTPE